MNYLRFMGAIAAFATGTAILSSCAGETSSTTGWDVNSSKNGGFESVQYAGQETGPGLVLVEGGTFTMGRVEDDLTFAWNTIPRRVTVSSFYIDETEVKNEDWREYVYWLKRVYGDSYKEVVTKALPDTLVWRELMEYNEPMVEYYYRHPAYNEYPVVGVNWLQSSDYCKWRTDRVNERILIREGILQHAPDETTPDEHFTTQSYLEGKYQGQRDAEGIPNLDPSGPEYRTVRFEDGMLLPNYRLPTEAEWEFAALGLIGNSFQELVSDRKTYPWSGHYVRDSDSGGKTYGKIRANFVRGRGDMMGVAGALNDFGDITTPVYQYAPNDYGLYNMAGNVSEWVMDVYRPLSAQDKSEFRPFRGNVYKTKVLDAEGNTMDRYDYMVYDVDGVERFLKKYQKSVQGKLIDTDLNLLEATLTKVEDAQKKLKDLKHEEANLRIQDAMDEITGSESNIAADLRNGISDFIESTPGDIRYRKVTNAENIDRRNYRTADNIDYKDGDFNSSIYYSDPSYEDNDERMYDSADSPYIHTMVNNQARVYKGGSWRDRAYWIIPGTRRFLDERQATATIGFRCAMDRVGSPRGFSLE